MFIMILLLKSPAASYTIQKQHFQHHHCHNLSFHHHTPTQRLRYPPPSKHNAANLVFIGFHHFLIMVLLFTSQRAAACAGTKVGGARSRLEGGVHAGLARGAIINEAELRACASHCHHFHGGGNHADNHKKHNKRGAVSRVQSVPI